MKAFITALIVGSVALSSASFACEGHHHKHTTKVTKKPVVEQPKK